MRNLITKAALPIAAVISICLLASCGNRKGGQAGDERPSLTVSIPPQAWALRQLAGQAWQVNVLLPSGADAEQWDPRPSDIRNLEQSRAWFQLGTLPFEQTMAGKAAKVVDTSKGIQISEAHGHEGGADPHIWLSPRNMEMMVRNMAEALTEMVPADSVAAVMARAKGLCAKIDSIGREAEGRMAPAKGETFLVWHPALGYYAADYGLHQVSLAGDTNKEMSVRGMRERTDRAISSGAKLMVLERGGEEQRASMAPEGVQTIAINLLDEDWPGMIDSLSTAFSRAYGNR